MDLRSELKFTLTDIPNWRNSGSIATAKMIEEIVELREKFRYEQEEEKKFCQESFARVMAVDFVYNVNIGEQVGSQTKAETEEILGTFLDKALCKDSDASHQDLKRTETLNLLRAMKKLHHVFEIEMEGQGLLTVEQICEVHAVLMKGLHSEAGKIRQTEAFTNWDGIYFYPPPDRITDRFYALVDCHNIYVDRCPPKYSKEEVEYVIKCAARIMFDFVDTHPFGDGNGRMCRLLANYVLGLITPFAVGIYHTDNKDGIGRKDYVNAIVQCRDCPEEGPCDIAAMLVEGVWRGWKNLYKNLDSRRVKRKKIGPLVIQVGMQDELSVKVDRLMEKGDIASEKEFVLKEIHSILKEVNTVILQQHEGYSYHCIDLEPNLILELKIFG